MTDTRASNKSAHRRHWMRSQQGNAIVLVAIAAVAILGFAVLAIDGAILMVTRTQLHNAADAAALAGASALVNGDENEAIARAIDFASQNMAYQESMSSVRINEDDITFLAPNKIRVRTHRTHATNDALRTFFMRVVNPKSDNLADMSAVATAQAFDVCGSRCLKPWAIPDRHDDLNGNGVWDPGESYHPTGTGYTAPFDVGVDVVLKVGNPQKTIAPGVFYAVNFPPLDEDESPRVGAFWYREWIVNCTPFVVEVGDRLQVEPGGMVGPTRQGMKELIGSDPGAYWNSSTKSVEGSAYALSPRIGLIPFFDPTTPPGSGRKYVTVVKLGAFFIESVSQKGEVRGRFIQITTQGTPCPGGTATSFVKSIALVE